MNKEIIEKLKSRRFPFRDEEGKWGFTDIFGRVLEPKMYDNVDNNPYEIKGIRNLDKKNPLSYRELINGYTNYKLPDTKIIEFTDEEHELFCNAITDVWIESHKIHYEKEILIDYQNYTILREDCGKVDINKRGIVRFGYLDKISNNFTSCVYDDIYPFKEGLARVYKSDKIEYLPYPECRGCAFLFEDYKIYREWLDDKKPLFDEVSILEEGRYGFIDNKGNEIIPFKYDNARDFSDGLAAVEDSGGWGYIDKNNNVIIPFKFEWADDFVDGYSRVLYAGIFYIIDKEGYCYETYEDLLYGYKSKFYI